MKIPLRVPLFVISIVMTVILSWNSAAAAQGDRRISLPFITLQISLSHNYLRDIIIIETFSTNDPVHHNVLCRSGFLDVRYTLRNSAGDIVPVNKEPWTRGSDQVLGSAANMPGADPCATAHTPVSERRVLLSNLYPDLPHGTYSLQITLAPRGRADSVSAQPITITI